MFNFFKSKKNKVDKQDANEVVKDVLELTGFISIFEFE